MFVGKKIVKLNQFEGSALIDSLIQAICHTTSKGYMKSLVLIMISFVIDKNPLPRSKWNNTIRVFGCIGATFPTFVHKNAYYFHKLYDSHFSDQERITARMNWNRMVDRAAVAAVDIHWNEQTMQVLERIRTCGINPEEMARIAKYLYDIDCIFVNEDAIQNLGELRLVS